VYLLSARTFRTTFALPVLIDARPWTRCDVGSRFVFNRAVSSVGVEVAVTLLEVTSIRSVWGRRPRFSPDPKRDMNPPVPSGDVRLRIIAVDAAASINTAMNNPLTPRKGSPHNQTI
jgi:hypothetical protein